MNIAKLAFVPALLLALASCSGKSTTTDSGASTDTGTTATTDTDTTTDPACTTLKDGSYSAGGACFGMTMSATLTFDATACSFTLDAWDMDMGNPTGGTVDGDTVTLKGGSTWKDCTGTIAGKTITGTCPSGCGWTLTKG